MRTPADLAWFELDLPDVFAFKEPVLQRSSSAPGCHRRVVPVDLRFDWVKPLIDSGFQPAVPTIWIEEGVIGYLSHDNATSLAVAITELSAPGSTFDATDFQVDENLPRYRLLKQLAFVDQAQSLDGLGSNARQWLDDQLRAVAGDSAEVEAVKVLSRAHKTLIWERTRHMQRLRHALREYFPSALEAFDDLCATDALYLLEKAPDPDSASRLTLPQIRAALKRARRRDVDVKSERIQAILRSEQLRQPPALTAGYAATTRSAVAVLRTLNEQIAALQEQVEATFQRHPDAEIVCSQPGMGYVLGARVLAEFGDDSHRYKSAKARKNYAGTSPVTRASGKKTVVATRFVHNDRLIDALLQQAFTAIRISPGARAFYDRQRARGVEHYAALRHVANRLVGILHGCLKGRSHYSEATAWANRTAETSTAA